jgi:hypothetical protein
MFGSSPASQMAAAAVAAAYPYTFYTAAASSSGLYDVGKLDRRIQLNNQNASLQLTLFCRKPSTNT